MNRVSGHFAALTVLALAAGCAEELGPERFPTARLTGRVHVQQRPIGRGWLEILPGEGARGRLTTAALRADGTFTAEGVPVGPVALRLVGVSSGDPGLDRALRILAQMPMIRDGRSASWDIDLRDELLRLSRSPSG